MAEPLDAGVSQDIDLGIDTASEEGALALLRGDAVLAEHRWRLATTYSRELLAALDALLGAAGVARTAIASIAVDAGPGGYGGLRTGVATAQGLALALGVPLAAVSRLEAEALPWLDGDRPVVAVHDAGRDRVAWAAYTAALNRGGPPRTLAPPRLDEAAACARAAPPGALWCGEVTDALRAAWAAAGRTNDAIAPPPATGRAVQLVRLARLHGAYGDPAAADVAYLRPPPITRPRAPAGR